MPMFEYVTYRSVVLMYNLVVTVVDKLIFFLQSAVVLFVMNNTKDCFLKYRIISLDVKGRSQWMKATTNKVEITGRFLHVFLIGTVQTF